MSSKLEKHLEKNSGKKSRGDDATKSTALSKKKKKDKKKKEDDDAETAHTKEKKKSKAKSEEAGSDLSRSPKQKKKKSDGESKSKEDPKPKSKKLKSKEESSHGEEEGATKQKAGKKKKSTSKSNVMSDHAGDDPDVAKQTAKKKKIKTEDSKKKKKKEASEESAKEDLTETTTDDIEKDAAPLEAKAPPADNSEADAFEKESNDTEEPESPNGDVIGDQVNAQKDDMHVAGEGEVDVADSQLVEPSTQQPEKSSQEPVAAIGKGDGIEQSAAGSSMVNEPDSGNEKSLGLELQEVCEAMMAIIKEDESSLAEMLSLQERLLNVFRSMNDEHLVTGQRLNARDEELQAAIEKNENLEREIEEQLADWFLMENKLVQADEEIKHLLAENQRLEAEANKARGVAPDDPTDFTVVTNSLKEFSNEIASAKTELVEAQKKIEGL
eukprot:CAMPEP_0176096478 /NCGR_PEP_ID=MMETSP0120_2-20121206/48365_1 /TAXON_ID=160619 /ORGANISM="Kryptoperidinium foliaceum, Strain CCMP 1326" /LENGTH=439 /DNA_ID=CAMNT_0017430463 /DNA_START=113 /DNA_END=1432 /DNA_ORIENTATION=-